MTGSEHMLHVGGKVSALSSFSLEEQNEIEQSPQRWCGESEAQRTPLWLWGNASEHTQHSTDAMPTGGPRAPRAERTYRHRRGNRPTAYSGHTLASGSIWPRPLPNLTVVLDYYSEILIKYVAFL